MRFNTLIMAALFCFLMAPARAGLDDDLNNFWANLGGSASVTSTTSFQGQSSGYFALGNVRARTGTRVTSLTSFSLPSVEAGCGGIDLFAGAFSFISEDELIQLSKAIAANAVGYAFDLALETISPVIAETMKDLRARLQELNLGNINSCETAKGIVNAVWPKQTLARDKICAELGTSNGIFTDYASGRHGCGTTSGQASATSSASDEQAEAIPDNVNMAWHIIRGERISSSYWLKDDNEMAEIAQTITGTIILASGDIKHFPSKALEDETINKIMKGGEFVRYHCGEYDDCLSISEGNITLDEDDSFYGRVEKAIEELTENIQNNTPPSADNIDMVNRTTMPLWRILNVHSAYSGPIISTQNKVLVEIVAIDLMTKWLASVVNEIRALAPSSELNGHASFDAWVESLRDLQRQVNALEISNRANVQQALEFISRVEQIEDSLASKLGNRAGDSSNIGQ